MKPNVWITLGASSGFISVAMGAFGAHALSQRLTERALDIYKTAAQYQIYHALALMGVGLWSAAYSTSQANLSGWCFTLGTLVFSGSLYALALTDIKILGAITPIGGVLFLVGWAAFVVQAWRQT